MARRALLSEAWWQQATIIPDDEREIAKHYTLDRSDLDLIMRQNKTSNRLGLASPVFWPRYDIRADRLRMARSCRLASYDFWRGRSASINMRSIVISSARRRGASIWPCFSTE
ncbi:hypothetical protein GCM10023069_69260 [Shinella granuli]